jgi:hypothetical protein
MSDALGAYLGVAACPSLAATGPSINAITLDASTEKQAWIFQAEDTAALTHGGFRYGTRTGTPPTYRLSLQGVDASGNPDGTVLGGGSPASATFTPPASAAWNSTWQWIALANAYTPTLGERLALVIDYSSGTIDGTNNSSFGRHITGFGAQVGFPYGVTDTTGAWVKQTNLALYGVKSASGVHGLPVENLYTTSDAVSGHRIAARILLPAGWGSTFKLAAIDVHATLNIAGTTYKIGIWQKDGTELETIALDGDHAAATANWHSFHLHWDATPELTYGTPYYVGFEAGGGTGLAVLGLTADTAAEVAAFPGGDGFYLATFNGTSWSEDRTTRPLMNFTFKDITPGGGGRSYILGA